MISFNNFLLLLFSCCQSQGDTALKSVFLNSETSGSVCDTYWKPSTEQWCIRSLWYQTNEECIWTFVFDATLNYVTFETEAANSYGHCVYDYMQLPFEPSTISSYSSRYCSPCISCGHRNPPEVVKAGEQVRWKTDAGLNAHGLDLCVTVMEATATPSSAPTPVPSMAPSSVPDTSQPTKVPEEHCTNSVTDVDETDVDCGGSCPGCIESRACNTFNDCASQNCNELNKCDAAPSSAPSIAPSSAPVDDLSSCRQNPCWTGEEACCDALFTSLFVTSKLTNRILEFDPAVKSYITFADIPMRVDRPVYIAFGNEGENGADLFVTSATSNKVEKYHHETGSYIGTLLDSNNFSDEAGFQPGVLRTTKFGGHIFIANETKSIHLFKNDISTQTLVFSADSNSGCSITDFTVRDKSTAEDSILYDILILNSCVDEETNSITHNIVRLADRTFSTEAPDAGSSALLVTLSAVAGAGAALATSIEFIADFSHVVVSLGSAPYLSKYSVSTGESATLAGIPAQIPSARHSLDIAMVRRGPNGLLYCSDGKYGLPVVFDEEGSLLGQLGGSLGFLADSFSLEFGGGASSWLSFVKFENAVNMIDSGGGGENAVVELVAGQEYGFDVVLKDSTNRTLSNDSAYADTRLRAYISGMVDINNFNQTQVEVELGKITHTHSDSNENVYKSGVLYTERASISADNKFSFGVYMGSRRLQLSGGPAESNFDFVVKPGNTSHVHTRLDKTFVKFEASETSVGGSFKMTTADAFGNRKSEGGEVGSFSWTFGDIEKDVVEVAIQDNLDGSYELFVNSKKPIASAFVLHVMFNGENILNSPVTIMITSGELSFLKTMENVVVSNSKQFICKSKLEVGDSGEPLVFGELPSAAPPLQPTDDDNSTNDATYDFVDEKATAPTTTTNKIIILPKDRHGNIFQVKDCNSDLPVNADLCKTFNVSVLLKMQDDETEYVHDDVDYSYEKDGTITYSFETDPLDCPEQVEVDISLGANSTIIKMVPDNTFETVRLPVADSIVMMTLGILCLLMCITYLLLCHRWRAQNAIKFSQKNLLYVILFGLIQMCVFVIVLSLPNFEGTENCCKAQLFMAPMGLATILLTVGAKTYRVQKIAYSKANQRVKLSDKYILKCIGCALGALFAYLMLYMILNTPRVVFVNQRGERSEEDGGSTHFGQVPICNWGKRRFQFPLVISLLVLISTNFVLAAQSRKIPSAFSESKWIALAAYCLLGSACMYAGAVNLGSMRVDNPKGFQYFFVILVLFNIFCFLQFLFLPKFINIMKNTKMELTDITKTINMEAEIEMRGMSVRGGMSGRGGAGGYKSERGEGMTSGGGGGGGGGAEANPMRPSVSKSEKVLGDKNVDLEKEVKILKKIIDVMKKEYAEGGRGGGGGASLPKNWSTQCDDEGRDYFFNSVTQQCSYEKPTL